MSKRGFSVRIADWSRDRAALQAIRRQVFIEEQGVPAELEWDQLDADALHLLAQDDLARPIGTARLLPTGQIGRMAVLRSWRGRGVGSTLLAHLLELAATGAYPPLFLHAQVTALSFYERQGFLVEGEEFLEAGIRHLQMRRADR